MSVRKQEKQRLIEQRDILRVKYPRGSIDPSALCPTDLLEHANAIVHFGPKDAGELYELSYEGAPGSDQPWYEPYTRGDL